MGNMNRDAIDFGKMNIPRLFVKLFIPTLLGLLFSACFNIADGAFVGRGVGSDALAAINISAPIFMLATGTALMFGSGASIVAAVHLSHRNFKAANINVTQALTVSLVIMAVCSALIYLFIDQTARLFGSSERLLPLVRDYLRWTTPSMVFSVLLIEGMFFLRLDGSPRLAMWVNVAASLMNIFLDWLMVFPLQWGIKGAAFATSLTQGLGGVAVLIYFLRHSHTIKLYRPKFSRTALRLTARNCGYMLKLGCSTFVAETGISVMMIVGNYQFMARLHEDGVAAFSIACYLFPLVLMFGNAVAQSALPIISYNHGLHNRDRIVRTMRLSLAVALACGLLTTVAGMAFSPVIASCFLDASQHAYQLAVGGIRWYAFSFLLFSLNVVIIGFYQSMEYARQAIIFMMLRSYILIIPCFMLLPRLIGNVGLWLAIPLSELLCLLVIVACSARKIRKLQG